jgi:uncharacterized protein (DUF2147 family)
MTDSHFSLPFAGNVGQIVGAAKRGKIPVAANEGVIMRRSLSIAVTAAIIGSSAANANGPAPITGRWQTDDGKAIIEVAPCGNAMCAKISRFLVTQPAGGARDGNNPDKALRSRPLLGVQILSGLRADGSEWKGQGYSPEEGRNFRATVTTKGNKLNLKGCVAVFCRTVQWTRAS